MVSPYCSFNAQEYPFEVENFFNEMQLSECLRKLEVAEKCLQQFMDFDWDNLTDPKKLKIKAFRLRSSLTKVKSRLQQAAGSILSPLVDEGSMVGTEVSGMADSLNSSDIFANGHKFSHCINPVERNNVKKNINNCKVTCEIKITVIPITSKNRKEYGW